MRDSIRQILFTGSSSQKETFKSYADAKQIGENILKSLWKKTVKVDGKMHFISDDKEMRVGFMSDVFGCACVFALVNRMKVELPDEYRTDLRDCLINILIYIENNGYNLSPYISDSKNALLFTNVYPYIGAMTWTLSLLANVRKASKSGLIDLDQKYDDLVVKHIRKIINKFNESVIGTADNPLGWNYTMDCKKPSLFFTYSVLEAFSDFEDSVMLEDQDGNPADTELLELINEGKINSHIEKDWAATCKKIAENVWQKYKSILKTDLISDDFLENIKAVSKDEIIKSSSSNALFNTIYVVFILVYGYANVRDNETEQEDVITTMDAALQNVQRIYEQLSKDNKEYIVDTYYMNYQSLHEERKEIYIKLLNSERIIDARIVPMLVKANNLVAFYISQYPQKQMSNLFLELFDRMNEQDWIWDNMSYDVENTERYIEAVADFYMYYDAYEKEYAERLKSKKEREKEAEDRVAKRIEKRLKEQIKQEMAVAHENEIEAVRQSYMLENLLRKSIKDSFCELITETIEHIVEANYGEDIVLDEYEKTLQTAFEKMIYSFADKFIRVNTESDIAAAQLRIKLKEDLEKFADGWVRKLKTKANVLIDLLGGEN